jgi:hypothetical protein
VALRGRLPAVVLLIDGCDCAQLVADTAAAVRADIAVITVSGTAPAGSAPGSALGGTTPRTGAAPPVQAATARAPAAQAPAAGQPAGQGASAQVPETATGATTVRVLQDPTGELRKAFDLAAADGTAAALLVGETGKLIRTVKRTATIEDFRPDLARL